MEDLTRLIISHERIENIKNNNLELSKEEAHYLNKVMRIKNGKKIFIANGEGSLWKAIKVKNDCLEIIKTKPDYLLILPWNLSKEIMEEMSFIRKWNGKFVILIPNLKIL